MGCKVTVLRAQRHGEFLAAQRQDPVTRKVFKAGDRVTLCAACLLPFLEDSWCGAGGAHCEQPATVGLEAFETATPADKGVGDPGDGDAVGSPEARPDAEAPDSVLRLRPVPCKLQEVPVKLRG
ncbi:MAG: hypothetical protein JOZ96_18360 [Acidobacteria bacterium]|nr:hypothetical protein [Acidobacteriota bacterium]